MYQGQGLEEPEIHEAERHPVREHHPVRTDGHQKDLRRVSTDQRRRRNRRSRQLDLRLQGQSLEARRTTGVRSGRSDRRNFSGSSQEVVPVLRTLSRSNSSPVTPPHQKHNPRINHCVDRGFLLFRVK